MDIRLNVRLFQTSAILILNQHQTIYFGVNLLYFLPFFVTHYSSMIYFHLPAVWVSTMVWIPCPAMPDIITVNLIADLELAFQNCILLPVIWISSTHLGHSNWLAKHFKQPNISEHNQTKLSWFILIIVYTCTWEITVLAVVWEVPLALCFASH